MAITARTILTQPAATAVAAVTLLGLTALGTGAFSSFHCVGAYVDPCERPVLEQNVDDWSKADWLSYVACYEARNDVRGVVRASTLALEHEKDFETIWNVKAYNQILLGEHEQATETLRDGLRHVEPTTGTMENNLAWSGLWTGIDHEEARDLYVSALEKTPHSCEMIHTGLFVEYLRAQDDDRYKRFWSLKAYKQLRQQYAKNRCETRAANGEWHTLAEVGGLGLLDEEVEKLTGRSDARSNPSLFEAGKLLRENYYGASIESFCNEAMPPSHASVSCVEKMDHVFAEVRGEAPRVVEKELKEQPCDMVRR